MCCFIRFRYDFDVDFGKLLAIEPLDIPLSLLPSPLSEHTYIDKLKHFHLICTLYRTGRWGGTHLNTKRWLDYVVSFVFLVFFLSAKSRNSKRLILFISYLFIYFLKNFIIIGIIWMRCGGQQWESFVAACLPV